MSSSMLGVSSGPAPALAAPALAAFAANMSAKDLRDACGLACGIQMDVDVARTLLAALRAPDASKREKLLGDAADTLSRHALKSEIGAEAESKRELAGFIDEIAGMVADRFRVAGPGFEKVGVLIAGLVESIVEGLRARWGASDAHEAIRAFVIDGVEPELAKRARESGIGEIGEIKGTRFGIGVVAPTDENETVGLCAVLFKATVLVEDGAESAPVGAQWGQWGQWGQWAAVELGPFFESSDHGWGL